MHLLSRTRTADVDAPLLQELRLLQASASGGARPSADEPLAAALPPPPPPLSPAKAASDKEFVRRMPYHVVPPYVEVNYKLMTFIMTRAPRIEDFPHERYAAFSPRSPKSCGDSLSLSLSLLLSHALALFFLPRCVHAWARARLTWILLGMLAVSPVVQDVHARSDRPTLPPLLQERTGVMRCGRI